MLVLKKINLPDDSINVLINTIKRFKIEKIISEKPYFVAQVKYLDDEITKKNIEIKALTRSILSQLKLLSENNPLITEEMKLTMVNVDEPGKIADFVMMILNLEKNESQEVLETINIKKRLEKKGLRKFPMPLKTLSQVKRFLKRNWNGPRRPMPARQ